MHTITNQTTEASLGAYFVDLFKLDVDQFHLSAQKPCSRDCDFLNRPYELSDLMQSHRCRSLAALTVSALPPKADMCSALVDVCFGPKADIPTKHRIVVFEPVVARNNRFLLIDADCSNYLQPFGLAWRLAGSRKLGPKRSCFPAISFHLSCRRGSKHRSVNPILVAPEQ